MPATSAIYQTFFSEINVNGEWRNRESYDRQMEEDPIVQDGSPAVNRGQDRQLSNVSFQFGVTEQRLPLPQKPWHPGFQH